MTTRFTRKQLLTPAVLGHLFMTDCGLPGLPVTLAEAIMRSWSIDEETLDRLCLRAYPSKIENLFVAQNVADRYGDLSNVAGFYRCRDLWWIDLDERYAGRGFLMPISDPRGLLNRMVAFRDVRDRHPFAVRTRRELRANA